MKRHVLWLALAVAALFGVAAYWLRRSETAPRTMPPVTVRPASTKEKSQYAPPPNQGVPKPKAIVAIQDGKTIDFSSGAPIVKDNAVEKALIEKSVKEMVNALQDVSFNQAAEKKKAEPEKAPPK